MNTTSISLAELRSGEQATLDHAEPSDAAWLFALGLAIGRTFKVRRAGDPFVLDVGATSIGLSGPLARTLRVHRSR